MDDVLALIPTYALVFVSVVVPYFVASIWMNSAKSADDAKYAGAPAIFRRTQRLLDVMARGIGASIAVAFPECAGRRGRELLKARCALSAEYVFAAQALVGSVLALAVCLATFFLKGESGTAIAFGAVAGVLGAMLPVMTVQREADRRQTEIIKSLPFAIDLLASAMRAGLDFIAAVRYYVTVGGKGALAMEFGLLLRQMELGKSRMEALDEMATHVQTQEFSAFVASVAHGTEIGASIVETLQIQGEDMRRTRFNLAERKAARAPSIMIFPIAIFIMPSVFAIVFVPVILRYLAAGGGV